MAWSIWEPGNGRTIDCTQTRVTSTIMALVRRIVNRNARHSIFSTLGPTWMIPNTLIDWVCLLALNIHTHCEQRFWTVSSCRFTWGYRFMEIQYEISKRVMLTYELSADTWYEPFEETIETKLIFYSYASIAMRQSQNTQRIQQIGDL